jgi:hypothetical protein
MKKRAKVAIFERKRASKFEEQVEKDLISRGINYAYESIKVFFTPPPKKRSKLWDWEITTDTGKQIIVEGKGWWESKVRLAETEAIKQNPQHDVRYLFQRASTKISKKSKTSYGDWCDKHGIQWAEGTIPQAWLEE